MALDTSIKVGGKKKFLSRTSELIWRISKINAQGTFWWTPSELAFLVPSVLPAHHIVNISFHRTMQGEVVFQIRNRLRSLI